MQSSKNIPGVHGSPNSNPNPGGSPVNSNDGAAAAGAMAGAVGGLSVVGGGGTNEGSNESLSSADTNSKSTFSRVPN